MRKIIRASDDGKLSGIAKRFNQAYRVANPDAWDYTGNIFVAEDGAIRIDMDEAPRGTPTYRLAYDNGIFRTPKGEPWSVEELMDMIQNDDLSPILSATNTSGIPARAALARDNSKGGKTVWNGKPYTNTHKSDEYVNISNTVEGAAMPAADFFTKEEVVEFAESVCDKLGDAYNDVFEIQDVWVQGNLIHLEVESQDEPVFAQGEVIVDMRRIRNMTDLNKYVTSMYDTIAKHIDEQTLIEGARDYAVEADPNREAYQGYFIQFSRNTNSWLITDGTEWLGEGKTKERAKQIINGWLSKNDEWIDEDRRSGVYSASLFPPDADKKPFSYKGYRVKWQDKYKDGNPMWYIYTKDGEEDWETDTSAEAREWIDSAKSSVNSATDAPGELSDNAKIGQLMNGAYNDLLRVGASDEESDILCDNLMTVINVLGLEAGKAVARHITQINPDYKFSTNKQRLLKQIADWYTPDKPKFSRETVKSGMYNMPEPSLEPPDYKEPTEEDDVDEEIEIAFDVSVVVDESGDVEDNDRYGSWCKNPDDRRGDWPSDTYSGVTLDDGGGACENFYELLYAKYEELIPKTPGSYKMSGTVHLSYKISNIQSDTDYFKEYEHDDDYSVGSDTTYFTDDADVSFVLEASSIDNLQFQPA